MRRLDADDILTDEALLQMLYDVPEWRRCDRWYLTREDVDDIERALRELAARRGLILGWPPV